MNGELILLLQDDNITYNSLYKKGYSIDDIAELANIASLVNRQDIEELCYKRIISFDKYNSKANYYYFYKSIINYNFSESLSYLKVLYDNGYYLEDIYTYLLLLNQIINLPNEIKEELVNLNEKDIYINVFDNRFTDLKLTNEIRKKIFEKDYDESLKLISSLKKSERKLNTQEEIINVLCLECKNKFKHKKDNIIARIQNGEIDNMYSEYKTSEMFLNMEEKTYLQLIYILRSIMYGRSYEIVKKGNSFDECIKNYDFEGAINYSKNSIVKELLELIIIENRISREESFKCAINNTLLTYIELITSSFELDDKESIILLINNYLNLVNRMEFKEYFNCMVEIAFLKGDIHVVIDALESLMYKENSFDTDYLIGRFFNGIKEQNFKKSETALAAITALPLECRENVEYEYLVSTLKYIKYLKLGIEYGEMAHGIYIRAMIGKAYHNICKYSSLCYLYNLNELDVQVAFKYFKAKDNVDYHFIKEGDIYNLFLRKKISNDLYDKEEYIKNAQKYIRKRNYEKAKEILLEASASSDKFDYEIINKLAYVYDKIGLKNVSKKFDWIARKLKEEMINDIEYLSDDEIMYFDSYNYDIDNIDEIIEDVMNGLNVLDVLTKYNVLKEDEAYIYVILAREYYKRKQFFIGDKCIINASTYLGDNELNRFINEIKTNRNYYSNRSEISFSDQVKLMLK